MSDNNKYNQNNGFNQNNQHRGERRSNQDSRQRRASEQAAAKSSGISSTVKGIIAIMLTLLVVIIVIMVFAKSLFINDSTEPVQTGVLTVTEYVPPATTTTEETTAKSTKKTASDDDEDEDDEDDDPYAEDYQEITCTSAVYLHPEPTSSSSNLLTIPSGAVCKYYRNESGWYYVEYNGTQGYAWHTFFSTPAEE